MEPKKYYSSISYTYTVPPDSGFISITPQQLAGLYEPHTDIVEKLLEYSDMQEAKDLIERIKR
jgi:hypothetical protein